MVDLKTLLLFTVFSALLFGCGTTISFEDTDKSEIAYEREEQCVDDTLFTNPTITFTNYPVTTLGCIKGRVVDYEGDPVPFSTVLIVNTEKGIQTDEVGAFFLLNMKPGIYDLKVKNMGYRTTRLNSIEVKKSTTTNIEYIPIEQISFDIEKPIIYLYPEEVTDVLVELDFAGELTHTYPKYNGGWNVRAHPDGTLYDNEGKEYYALYWEGESKQSYTLDEGFVIPGEETIVFLEKALEQLGLNRKEANEFIIYWLPQMEGNKYNLIHFSTTEYTENAKLNITPKPDTLIRVMMVFKPIAGAVSIKEQNLSGMNTKRTGFTVVEWGGCRLP
jgi:hypothetical protein